MNDVRWVFDRFELFSSRGELRQAGRIVPIGRKPMAMLVALLRARGEVVGHEALRSAIWRDVTVSDAAYASVVRDLRRALGDEGQAPRFVVTERGRGLRFAAELLELPERPSQPDQLDEDGPGESSMRGRWPEIARQFEAALAALDRLQESRGTRTPVAARERGELLLSLGRARWASGETEAARSAFLDAAGLARGSGATDILARAALGFAGRTDVTLGVRDEAVVLLREALEALGDSVPSLRAEVLARLGTELHQDGEDPQGLEPRSLTAEAMRIAEAADDPVTLAYSLTAHHFTQQRPEVDPRERLALADRAISLVEAFPPSDVLALGYQERLLDLLEVGDGARFEATWTRYDALVERLDQPFFLWIRELFRGNRALLAGDVAGAERHAGAAFELGSSLGTPNALAAHAGQTFAIRLEQGRLSELRPLLLAEARERQQVPVFRAAALTIAANGEGARGLERELHDLFAELGRSARDQHWLAALALLSRATRAVGDTDLARRLRAELAPFEDRLIVVGYGAAILGAVAHDLGNLAAQAGDASAASGHFRRAEALYESLGAERWRERARQDRVALEG